jgi:hypothetical protein
MKLLSALKSKVKTYKLYVWFILIFMCFIPLNYIQWQIHYLFQWYYGVPFQWSWALPNFIAEVIVVASIGLASAVGYWLIADESSKDKWTMILLTLTVWWQWFCGAYDFVWHIINLLAGNPFPAWDLVWWWNPYSWLFGIEWTTLHMVGYMIILEIILVLMWLWWYYKFRNR